MTAKSQTSGTTFFPWDIQTPGQVGQGQPAAEGRLSPGGVGADQPSPSEVGCFGNLMQFEGDRVVACCIEAHSV